MFCSERSKRHCSLRGVYKSRMSRQSSISYSGRAFELTHSSQLLDLLLDVNESTRIPIHLRYDIRSPTPDASAVPELEPDIPPRRAYDTQSARARLEEAKVELATGQITPTSYSQLEITLSEAIKKPRGLAHLTEIPHTTLHSVTPDAFPSDLDDEMPTGYLSPDHEEEYLSTLDTALGTPLLNSSTRPLLPSSHPPKNHTADKHEKEKEAQLRNPVSVYNWLRKHQPQVFLQDHESLPALVEPKPSASTQYKHTGPKPSPKPSSTSNKAPKRSNTAPKLEHDTIDEDGFVVAGGHHELPAKSKRKREDEPYRPKGGSSRPTKKKKVSGGSVVKRVADEEDGD